MKALGLIAVFLLAGCGPTAKPEPSDFALRELTLSSTSDQSGEVYELTGHGKRCYIAGFGVAKTLLWCEDIPQVKLIPPQKLRAPERYKWNPITNRECHPNLDILPCVEPPKSIRSRTPEPVASLEPK